MVRALTNCRSFDSLCSLRMTNSERVLKDSNGV